MNKFTKLLVGAVAVFGMTGCSPIGEKVMVPAAHVAKVFGQDGFKEGIHETKRFRLEPCLFYCEKLVLLPVSDNQWIEHYDQLIPRDQLRMKYSVNTVLGIKRDKDTLTDIFNKMPSDRNGLIDIKRIYHTYAQQRVYSITQQTIADYTIDEIATDMAAVEVDLRTRLMDALDGTPFMLKNVGIINPQYPSIIIEAKENAAEREVALDREKAELEIVRVKMQRDKEEAEKQAEIDKIIANSQKEVNSIMSDSVNENYVLYKQLEALSDIAKSDNKVFIPFAALDSVGANNMMLNPVK
ncbi:putative Band 7 protein [Vibrio chagasii]|nr:putative Band 7 protein [Vibrio chagasii]